MGIPPGVYLPIYLPGCIPPYTSLGIYLPGCTCRVSLLVYMPGIPPGVHPWENGGNSAQSGLLSFGRTVVTLRRVVSVLPWVKEALQLCPEVSPPPGRSLKDVQNCPVLCRFEPVYDRFDQF